MPTSAARIALLLGAVLLADGLFPHLRAHLAPLVPPLPHAARTTATATIVVCGVMLLRIAAGLRRRKHAAWRIAVTTGVAVVVADLARGERRPVEAACTVLLIVSLIAGRKHYTARLDPRSRWSAPLFAVQSVLAATAYGMAALLLHGAVALRTTVSARLTEVVESLVGLGGSLHIRDQHFAAVFHTTLLGWGLLTLVVTLVLGLRSGGPLANLDDDDDERLRTLLTRHGSRDSLGYFALRRDKSVVWSPTGKAAITYRVVDGVALIGGDPLGDPEAWPGAIAAYRDLVHSYGWMPAAIGCSETGAIVLRRELGISTLALGDEAVLDVETFSLDGRAMRGVRQACTRVERAGYALDVRRVRDLTSDEVDELRASAARWRIDPVERGFSMALSRLGEPGDGDCVVATAILDGQLRGLLHFVPWGRIGISLDVMRRDRASDNGLNEFMIAGLMQACPGLGVSSVSLNFAVFRDALARGAQIGAGPVVRAWRRVLLLASRWWQIESLYRFNDKFQPRWEPRFVCYPATRDLPRIALAALEAEAFLVRPRILRRRITRA